MATFIESFVQMGFVSNGYGNELVDKISIRITLLKHGCSDYMINKCLFSQMFIRNRYAKIGGNVLDHGKIMLDNPPEKPKTGQYPVIYQVPPVLAIPVNFQALLEEPVGDNPADIS